MRELKVRIWDGNNNKYDYPDIVELNSGLEYEHYIGRKDINKKMIFEGDILQSNELNWIGQCVYKYDRFMLIDNRNGFSEPCWEACEIIGNIHLNQELLEQVK